MPVLVRRRLTGRCPDPDPWGAAAGAFPATSSSESQPGSATAPSAAWSRNAKGSPKSPATGVQIASRKE